MPCDCDQCHQHRRTLGVAIGAASKDAIHKAYRKAAKRWHPDRFEKYPRLRSEAEEHFKRVQVAYQELTRHHEAPVAFPVQGTVARAAVPQSISFGGAPGCLVAPNFTPHVEQILTRCLGTIETALAIVDLAGPESRNDGFSQFFLLATQGFMVRDSHNFVSLLWYSDLGEIKLIDRRKNGKLSRWQELVERICGSRPNYSLQIYRRNGTHFYSISGHVDDRIKAVIYKFLMRQKSQTHS
jgi:hypothetical protein